MSTFSFKSSGTTAAAATANALAKTSLPVGIVTPLALGNDDLLKMHTSLADQLADNMRNLIMTNWGERLGFYDFGANLRPLTVDLVSIDDFETQAIDRIKNAITKWMPFIEPVDFTASFEAASSNAKSITAITLMITFNIARLNVQNRKLKVTLFVI